MLGVREDTGVSLSLLSSLSYSNLLLYYSILLLHCSVFAVTAPLPSQHSKTRLALLSLHTYASDC